MLVLFVEPHKLMCDICISYSYAYIYEQALICLSSRSLTRAEDVGLILTHSGEIYTIYSYVYTYLDITMNRWPIKPDKERSAVP